MKNQLSLFKLVVFPFFANYKYVTSTNIVACVGRCNHRMFQYTWQKYDEDLYNSFLNVKHVEEEQTTLCWFRKGVVYSGIAFVMLLPGVFLIYGSILQILFLRITLNCLLVAHVCYVFIFTIISFWNRQQCWVVGQPIRVSS